MMATQIRLTEMSRLPNVLIPVPIAYTTAVQRTLNQSALLAWHLAKTFNIAYAPRLLMRQGGPAQRSLSRGRRLTSTGFACRQNAENLAGKHFAIVDGVLTTAATARPGRTENAEIIALLLQCLHAARELKPKPSTL